MQCGIRIVNPINLQYDLMLTPSLHLFDLMPWPQQFQYVKIQVVNYEYSHRTSAGTVLRGSFVSGY